MDEEIDMQDEQEALDQRGQHDDEALGREIAKKLKYGRRHLHDWRTRVKEDYDFFAGHQWDVEDKEKLREENRPCVTFNRIARTINSVIGLELQNRQTVAFIPRQVEDTGYNEVLTEAAKWARENCNAEDEESEAFQDSVISGMGYTETSMCYEENPDGEIIEDRIDPLEMLYDPSSKKRNLADARWIARESGFYKDEFLETFPDAKDVLTTIDESSSGNSPHLADPEFAYKQETGDVDQEPGKIKVVQYQYYKRETYYRASVDGQMVEMSKLKYDKLTENGLIDESKTVKQVKRVYYQCFLVGNNIIEKVKLDCNRFTFKAMTGLRDSNKNLWFGLVSMMKDPQRWANKWLSQIQHIVNSGAKNGVMAERSAIYDANKFEQNYSKPGSISYVEDGAISGGKIQQKNPPPYPQGVDRLLEFAIQGINDVPGINLELIGMANRDQAIGLEDQRKQAGITILATFFDSLRRYRKEQGRLLAFFIREYISDGRLIRIVGDDGAKFIPLIRDQVSFDYDVIVDDSPTSANMKEKVFKSVTAMLPMLLQSGIPIPPDLLDYAPLPSGLIENWKKLIESSKQNPEKEQLDQIKMMLAQLSTHQAQADIDKTVAETQEKYAKAEQAHAVGQDEMAQSMQKMGMTNQEHENKQQTMMMEQKRKDIEMYLNHQRKILEAKLNAEVKNRVVE